MSTVNHTNAAPTASQILHQARGVLNLLWERGAFDSLPDESSQSSIWAVQTLLNQAQAMLDQGQS